VNPRARLALAGLAAATPAVLGAVLFARLQPVGRGALAAFVLGAACGVMVLGVSRSRGAWVVAVSVAAALVGVALGFVLDAQWNAFAQVAAAMEREYGLGPAEAAQQARTLVGGTPVWDLIRSRLTGLGLLSPVLAVAGAALAARSGAVARLFRIPAEGGG
jgi:hypothetical protein